MVILKHISGQHQTYILFNSNFYYKCSVTNHSFMGEIKKKKKAFETC